MKDLPSMVKLIDPVLHSRALAAALVYQDSDSQRPPSPKPVPSDLCGRPAKMDSHKTSSDPNEEVGFLQEKKGLSENLKEIHSSRRRRAMHVTILYAFNLVLLLALTGSILTRPKPNHREIYTPAEEVIEYKDVLFLDNVDEKSPYQGEPPYEIDQMWQDLYQGTSFTVIDKHAPRKLPNATVMVPGSDGDAIIFLEVFHQLHCLNMLRRVTFPERYPDYALWYPNGTRNGDTLIHFDHCIDRIRQGLMCAANTGEMYYRWSPSKKFWHLAMSTTHTCRNFEAIRDWAVGRNKADWDQKTPSRLATDN